MRRSVTAVVVLGVLGTASLAGAQPPEPVEATSLLGRPLRPPSPLPNREALEADLRAAQSAADLGTADATIWIGRRLGYLWRYREAVETFSAGIARHPADPRLYRHRGHRYITLRQFARAEADLARAAELMASRPDEIEPDGQPNAAGRPRGTLHFNVWYHLGLARYLQGNFQGALDAYRRSLEVSSNDDALVATSDWLWMTLMRLRRPADAEKVLERITPTMEILENGSYHRRLLMYKGLATPESLLEAGDADATTVATQGYGVGNYYLVRGEAERARATFERVVAGSGWNAFGYIASEVELAGRPQRHGGNGAGNGAGGNGAVRKQTKAGTGRFGLYSAPARAMLPAAAVAEVAGRCRSSRVSRDCARSRRGAHPMPKYVIERELPGAGQLTPAQLMGISQKSCSVLSGLGPQIQWVHSYVTGDKIYCVYIAPNEEMVREHARQGGFPANSVAEVKTIIDPTTAEA